MDIVIQVSLFYLLIHNIIYAEKLHVCKRMTTDAIPKTIYYCCKNYHEVNNVCEECPKGYTSETGVCFKCPDNFYGIRCRKTCDCLTNKSCHHMYGCLESTTQISSEKPASTGNEDYVTSNPSCTSTEQGEQTTGFKPGTSSSGYTIIYLLLIGVPVAIAFIVLIAIFNHRCKCAVILSTDPGDINQSGNLPPNEHVYHVIDDDLLVDIDNINTQPREQNEQRGKHALPIRCDDISDRSSYLDPCSSSHLSDEQSNEYLDGIISMNISHVSSCVESSSSDGNTEHTTQMSSEYLHPYCTLLPSDVGKRTYSVVNPKTSEDEIKHTTDYNDRSVSDISNDVDLYVSSGPSKFVHKCGDNIDSYHTSENEVGQQMNDTDNTYINTDIFPGK